MEKDPDASEPPPEDLQPPMVRPYVPRHALDGDEDLQFSRVDPLSPRPYLLTAGRVRPVDEALEIEAQVVTSELGRLVTDELTFETRDIVMLCESPMSVAEIAAKLGLHIGVVRILVGDVVERGHLNVLRPRPGMARDPETLERVIRGLKAIS